MPTLLSPAMRIRPLLVTFFGILIIIATDYLGFFAIFDHAAHDLSLRLAGPQKTDERIVIVAIDDTALGRLGRWPIRRVHYATLVDALKDARVIAFDIIMAEPSLDDAALHEAMVRHGNVILPVHVGNNLHVVPPAASLGPATTGHIHVAQDVDGVARTVFHTLKLGNTLLPSLASAIRDTTAGPTATHTGAPLPFDDGQPTGLFQADPMRIRYMGPSGTFPQISLSDLLDDAFPARLLHDKIALVGVTAAGIDSGFLTPFSAGGERMSGVEVQANIVDNLMAGGGIRIVDDRLRWLMILAVCMGCFFIALPFVERWSVLVWLAGLFLITLAVHIMLARQSLWIPPTALYFSLTFGFFMAYATGIREMKRLVGQAKDDWEDAYDTIDDGIILFDENGAPVRQNRAATELSIALGPKPEDPIAGMIPRPLPVIFATGTPSFVPGFVVPYTGEWSDRSSGRHFDVRSFPRTKRNGSAAGFVMTVKDITERKKAEQEQLRLQTQLLQAQKMESIGRLAGGIAHDFNNLLTAILGYSELGLMVLPPDSDVYPHMKIINEAGGKAKVLVQQILAFSRKLVLEFKVVDMNALIDDMGKMMQRIIGEDIVLKIHTASPVSNVTVDPGQIEQVLMNLIVNARDAMPSGGTLSIETADVDLDGDYAGRHNEIAAGSYVMVSVTDTGAGMPVEVQEKIFDPFYTTKEVGKGTGLGLSTVYGIVRQHNGHIYVYSEVGKGTTFKIYLPASSETIADSRERAPVMMRYGTETVMVVEDDLTIRALITEVLRPLGYRVLTAASGDEAIKIEERVQGMIDLLLVDVVMPGMNGKELADRMTERRPGLKVIFMSGYTDETIVHHGVLDPDINFLQKPLQPRDLMKKLWEVFDLKPCPG